MAYDLGIYGARLEILRFTRHKKRLSLKEVEYSKKVARVHTV